MVILTIHRLADNSLNLKINKKILKKHFKIKFLKTDLTKQDISNFINKIKEKVADKEISKNQ